MILTERAANQIKLRTQNRKPDSYALRLAVINNGCSGLQYDLSLVELRTITNDDQVVEQHGIKIVVDVGSKHYVENATIDFQEGLIAGFKIINPCSKKTCGCGRSFEHKDAC